MKKPVFRAEVSVDEKTGKVMAVYFQIREGASARTEEVCDGKAFADYDKKGLLLGVELLAPCQVEVWDKIAKKEPAPVKRFLRGATPQELVLS